MRKKTILFTSILLVFIASCGEKKKVAPLSLPEKIKKAESKYDITQPLNKQNLLTLIELYKRFADSLPKNPKSPVYLIRTCDYYGTLKMQQQKCDLYQDILIKYPDFKDADMVMYLLASAYDSDLNNRVDAKKYYQLYLEKYPTSTYILDAKSRLLTIDSLSFNELQDRIIHQELEGSK